MKDDYGYDVSYYSGNVFVCGSMYSSDNGLNAFVAKLDSDDLSEEWFGVFKATQADHFTRVYAESSGVYALGYSQSPEVVNAGGTASGLSGGFDIF